MTRVFGDFMRPLTPRGAPAPEPAEPDPADLEESAEPVPISAEQLQELEDEP
jgi:hypothetical protein